MSAKGNGSLNAKRHDQAAQHQRPADKLRHEPKPDVPLLVLSAIEMIDHVRSQVGDAKQHGGANEEERESAVGGADPVWPCEIDPAFGEGQKGYARVLMDLKRYPEAARTIRAALRLMPGDSDLISWEREIDSLLLTWHIRQEQEANRPLLIKRVVPESRS